MKQNIARDLLLLAAVAFQQKRYDAAGNMFAAAMSSDDAQELLEHLDVEGDLKSGDEGSDDWNISESGDAPRASLAEISKSLSNAMSDFPALSADDDEEDDTSEIPDEEEEDSDDADSDDFDEEVPGQKIIPSSLSSAHQGGGSAKTVKLVMGSNSPVRIK